MRSRSARQPPLPTLLVLLALPVTALLCSLNIAWTAPAHAAAPTEIALGASTAGRPITAVRFGDGPLKLVVVGDTHGGPEANTYVLTTQLIEHFRAHPEEVPAGVRMYLIPTLNPDGLELGSRFNANFVDLNRNMNTNLDGCAENDWRTTVQGAYGLISDTGGPYPDSEVESRLIRAFLLDAHGAIFLHSNAGLVFPAFCDHQPSVEMAEAYASAAGYAYARFWTAYFITGGMHDWAGSMGIAAITPELISGEDSEFEQNLAGLRAVLARADELLPPIEDRVEAGVAVPGIIWRYWKANGGAERFGEPLTPAEQVGATTRQLFERAALELRPDQIDTPYLVQPMSLGRHQAGATLREVAASCEGVAGPCRQFPETSRTLRGAFLDYWERGGVELFGLPLSEELTLVTADGRRRTAQYFERAVLALYPEDGSVRLEPLGLGELVRKRLNDPTAASQIR